VHRWEGYIKMDFEEVRCEGVKWIQLMQDRVQCQAPVNMIMDLQVL
jgi:hypothetical protein